jgi:hypothetical protein
VPRTTCMGNPLSRKTSSMRRFSGSTSATNVSIPRSRAAAASRAIRMVARPRPRRTSATSKAISAASSRINSKPACPTIRSGCPAVATSPIPPRSGAVAAHRAAERRSAAAVKNRSQRASGDRPSRKRHRPSSSPATTRGRGRSSRHARGRRSRDARRGPAARHRGDGRQRCGQAVVAAVVAASALGVATPRGITITGQGDWRMTSIAALPTITRRIGP